MLVLAWRCLNLSKISIIYFCIIMDLHFDYFQFWIAVLFLRISRVPSPFISQNRAKTLGVFALIELSVKGCRQTDARSFCDDAGDLLVHHGQIYVLAETEA